MITVLMLLFLIPSGCQSVQRQSPLLQKLTKKHGAEIQMSAEELSIHVKELTVLYSGVIEEAADEIIERSPDPHVRRQAMLWKMNAIPAAHTAIYHPDPLIALLDIWAFSIQMKYYFDTGRGRSAFGEWHVIALEASQRLETAAMDLAKNIRTDGKITIPQKLVEEWARKNPIESPLFYRRSSAIEFASVTAKKNISSIAAVGKLAFDMDDIAERLAVYSEHLPKQVRWEFQMLLEDLMEKEEILGTLQRERALVMQDIDDQRIATLAWFGDERALLTADAERLIDHFFLRAAQLVFVLLLLFLIAGVVLIRVMRKKSTGK